MSAREKREYVFSVVSRSVQQVSILAYSEKDARADIKAGDGDYDDPGPGTRVVSVKRVKDAMP